MCANLCIDLISVSQKLPDYRKVSYFKLNIPQNDRMLFVHMISSTSELSYFTNFMLSCHGMTAHR